MNFAREMLNRARGFLSMLNELGETVLFRAARYGKIQIFNFLANEITKEYDETTQQPFFQRNDKTTILHIAILA